MCCRRCRSLPWLILVAAATVASSARADETTPATAVEARVAALEAEVRALREEAKQHPAPDPRALRLGPVELVLSGFIQADAVAYHQASVDELDPSTGEPLNRTRFSLTRARLRATARWGFVSALLELDGNTVSTPTARVTTAELAVEWPRPRPDRPPLVRAAVGLVRIPWGFEVQELDWQRLFLERSTVARALFPGEFDFGLRVEGGWRAVRYQAAVLNGHPSGDRQFALRDPSQAKDLVARLGVDGAPQRRLRVIAGVSGLWGTGFSPGVPATKDSVVWRDANGDGQVDATELIGVRGRLATPSQTFTRYAIGADARLIVELPRIGALTVGAELTWASNLDRGLMVADPVAVGRDLRELGWSLLATQQLTRWAAVGVRYDRYDPDADAREQAGSALVPRDRSFSTWTVVAAASWSTVARLSLEWAHQTNPLGRDASGAPATLGSDAITARAQVVY